MRQNPLAAAGILPQVLQGKDKDEMYNFAHRVLTDLSVLVHPDRNQGAHSPVSGIATRARDALDRGTVAHDYAELVKGYRFLDERRKAADNASAVLNSTSEGAREIVSMLCNDLSPYAVCNRVTDLDLGPVGARARSAFASKLGNEKIGKWKEPAIDQDILKHAKNLAILEIVESLIGKMSGEKRLSTDDITRAEDAVMARDPAMLSKKMVDWVLRVSQPIAINAATDRIARELESEKEREATPSEAKLEQMDSHENVHHFNKIENAIKKSERHLTRVRLLENGEVWGTSDTGVHRLGHFVGFAPYVAVARHVLDEDRVEIPNKVVTTASSEKGIDIVHTVRFGKEFASAAKVTTQIINPQELALKFECNQMLVMQESIANASEYVVLGRIKAAHFRS